jgi:serine/threonine-protein kinase
LHDLDHAFAVFDAQDSGCIGYGIEADGARWFVKRAIVPEAAESLDRAVALHAAVCHDAIVPLVAACEGPTVVYPWRDGTLLNHATVHGTDRSGLARFQQLPVAEVESALDTILDAHLALSAAGYVVVDLYDGCFLYDFDTRRMHLIDLDEYRPGPFTLTEDRLPGSLRYMPPEQLERGARVDHRSSVFQLGRTLHHLLDSPSGWRGTPTQAAVVTQATRPAPSDRFPDVPALATAWRAATG